MGLEDRPYVGTWQLNNQQVIRHTPDCLVYFNGDLAIPGCPTCGSRINLMPYITQVSVDPSTDPPATASISLHVPRQMGDNIFHDGRFRFGPGIEVHIYMRGYFPVKGLLAETTPQETGGIDMSDSVLYPYYMVFHGVVTEVDWSYDGGEHTASISCADLLHFWQFQRMSTQGSLFGARPMNSKVKMSLVGHNLTGMSPYSIIYTLFRDVAGAAGGVEFALGNETNAAANSTVVGESLFSLNILYWEKRFSQNTLSLRMYGMDGTLYNNAQQAFIGSIRSSDIGKLAKRMKDKTLQTNEHDPLANLLKKMRLTNFNFTTVFAPQESEDDAKKGGLGVNTAQIHAFVSDIGNWGEVNMFDSVYQTKIDVANTVKEAVGYEFYMDVDGDIVFKPPFYNLDTSTSRAYVIKDIDIINLTVKEGEPEATVVKATGSWFKNLQGTGTDNEWGVRGEFMDYKMVAKFGWRQPAPFETAYHTNPRAMFYAAVNRYDLYNLGVNSATCTIPIRPELRPGYPVYIEPLDCFYYLTAFSHTFSFGGRCTTSLTLQGRRAKFYAPGKPPEDGRKAGIGDIDLSNMHLPAIPLEVIGFDDVPRLQGFPNVVMTLDPNLVNPLQFLRGYSPGDLNSEDKVRDFVRAVRSAKTAVLQLAEEAGDTTSEGAKFEDGPWKIQTGNDTADLIVDTQTLAAQATQLVQAFKNAQNTSDEEEKESIIANAQRDAPQLTSLLEAVRTEMEKALPGTSSTASTLELLADQKASFNPGKSMPGYYRYYSASHPDPAMQGMSKVVLDPDSGMPSAGDLSFLASTTQTFGFSAGVTSGAEMGSISVTTGIPIAKPGGVIEVTPTHLLKELNFAQVEVRRVVDKWRETGKTDVSLDQAGLSGSFDQQCLVLMKQRPSSLDTLASEFEDVFDRFAVRVQEEGQGTTLEGEPSFEKAIPEADTQPLSNFGFSVTDALQQMAKFMGEELARAAEVQMSERLAKVLEQGDSDTDSESKIKCAWASLFGDDTKKTVRGVKKRTSREFEIGEKHFVPVFPVSDERGYEVIGNYRYGRGLSIEVGGNFEQLNSRPISENTSYEAIEAFLAAIDKETSVSKAVGELHPETQAALAEGNGVSGEEFLSLVETGDLFREGFRARAANARQMPQKTSIVNAAYSLADLTPGAQTNICSCKGAQADFLLQAFNTDMFVQVESDQIDEWASEQMVIKSTSWRTAQQALRGQVSEGTGDSLFDAFQAAHNTYAGGSSGILQAQGVGTPQQAIDEGLAEAKTALDSARDALRNNNEDG